ncbi:complement C1q-like protein 2 isoform X2 [Platichthys flesus]|uniref:complement C1q-like protein 2 isoform X2 n=1 Tax=Platichthys flesus TaxID=8260 RepID=UPI002DB75D27|nr:complement C1q-like protein 2 isoform X2 [Platichthys flesus]
MEVTMFFPLLLLICSHSTAQPQPESDNEIIPLGDNQTRQPANVSLPQPTCPQDIHAVLREMSGLLAEQRVELRHLQRENDEQAGELTAIKARTNLTENQVEALRRETEGKRVAFTAALSSSETTIGPFNTQTNLVFTQVITNIGNAYNTDTGFFIAPVKGVYHFELYICAYGDPSYGSAVWLVRNGHNICIAYERQPSYFGKSANGATLLLEVGDVVFLRLDANSEVYDNEHHQSTFSGHLLFTM